MEDNREVSREMGEKFCNSHDINFFLETSAKTGFNAENVFIEASKLLYEQHLKYKDRFSRPDSIHNMSNGENFENNNNVILENENEDEDDDENNNKKRKKCC